MQFSTLYGSALDIELGSADRTSLFTTARRQAAINAGQLEFIKRTGCFRRVASIALADDTREYDLESASNLAATDFLKVWDDGVELAVTVGSDTTYRSGQDFPRRDVPMLNRQFPGWRSATATSIPQSWYLKQDGGKVYFGLSEPPSIESGDSAAVTLPYVARAADMSADADKPFTASSDALNLLEPWHQALAHYGAAVLERLRKNVNAEQKQLALFAGYVADYLQAQAPTDGETVMMARDYRAEQGRFPTSRVQRDPLIY